MRRSRPADLAETLFDLIVIGGGITGVATAREAALRGLSVLLVEKDDFAAGTSSRSSKLIHGGLRYLQTYQFALVAESLRERERMLTLAPHLTEVRPFLYLLYDGYPEGRTLLNAGLTFYDAASGEWMKRRHRMLSARKVLDLEPHLRRDGLLGAGQYYDVLTDDARLTVDHAKGAAEAGAQLLNHAAVSGLLVEGGRTRGVRITDQLDGNVVEVHARVVASATGPWTDQTLALERGDHANSLRPTKGVHIVLRKSDFPLNTAVFLRSPDDNRVVWPTPSLEDDLVYIGTTDTDFAGDLDVVTPDEDDITYLLNVANHTIPDARVTEDHIVGSWAGLRPLVAAAPGTTTGNTSREHVISEGPTGLLAISGGKLTSSRVMAQHLVEVAVTKLRTPVGPSVASSTPISGGSPGTTLGLFAAATALGVPDDIAGSWVRRYGSNAGHVLRQWQDDTAAREVVGPRGLTVAEVRYCVAEEMVLTLCDLLVRRTSLFFWDAAGSLAAADQIAAALAAELGWDEQRRGAEVAAYRKLVHAHLPGHR
ncbi:glycerol-3-phosphate dehydrogenase/oxidase [Tessaracoccus sp. SD287]|uniref:glycerol-3-phosphate dehydrogenase/oxidase n=1 Tax=Tessaracoccus sp. SD287 TaxID=2782008 RepID=UPI001A974515|nr:glycerol-3-phosphate dehydrogenase/oxidase [Tessaracoccus sp. SD287]MBO1032361.1 glycerol-3-phosphate dehydrogenase/oxidase [Tessaracoccus sp. SD287]